MKKTVLITGCSSGFGKVTAALFAQKGWNVVATMRNPADGQDLSRQNGVFVTRLDVQEPQTAHAAIAEGISRFGRIDLLINNAGFGLFGLLEATSPEKIREQFEVNVFGVMETTRAILPHFRANKGGVIVNVSSGAGVFTLPMLSLYCASKFALEGFSEGISYELLSQNIVMKIVEPGGVTSTKFGERSAAETAQNAAVAGYESFVENTQKIFAELREGRRASESHVAEEIFAAATDGTTRLRYVITDDIKPLVAARRETNEESYLAMMRKTFLRTP